MLLFFCYLYQSFKKAIFYIKNFHESESRPSEKKSGSLILLVELKGF
jgi:hypothetical protein